MSAARDPRSIVRGHRRCARCRYQLAGQPIVRDPHHDLFIVRCPECATVASILEQPMPGHFADRLPLAMAVVWVALAAGAWIGGGMGAWGLGYATAQIASEEYATELRKQFEEETGEDAFGGQVIVRSGIVTQGPSRPGGVSFGEWWKQRDHAQRFAAAGGWRGAVHPAVFLMLIPCTILGFAIGLFWSVVFTRRSLLTRLLFVPLLLAPAAIGSPMYIEGVLLQEATWTRTAALQEIGTPALLVTLGYFLVVVAVTIAIGRRLARRLLRWTIPASMLEWFADLWLCDGKELPARG